MVGLGFGDEGKGSIVDHLVREHRAAAVVRFSGGSQCGHRVVTPDGREHVFAQFGAGTFVDGVETYLSQHVLVNPLNLFEEEEGLRKVGVDDALDRFHVHADAVIVTPFHVRANRIRELLRGDLRHGTCGEGIGEARGDSLKGWMPTVRVSDVFFEDELLAKLRQIQLLKRQALLAIIDVDESVPETLKLSSDVREAIEAEMVEVEDDGVPEILVEEYGHLRRYVVPDLSALASIRCVVFEGAQGILLDETYGYRPPHTTWTTTTSRNAHEILNEIGDSDDRRTIGVTRSYMTRHGAGPFPTEAPIFTDTLRDAANVDDGWQGEFRVGGLDLPLLDYAVRVDGRVDEVAVTCLDRRPDEMAYAVTCDGWPLTYPIPEPDLANPQFRIAPASDDAFVEMVEMAIGLPVTIRSDGPTADDKS